MMEQTRKHMIGTHGGTTANKKFPSRKFNEWPGLNRILGMAILALGIMLIIFGMKASDSVESDFSKVFSSGTTITKALWLLAGGIIAVIVGGMISLRPERRQRDPGQMNHKT